MTEQSSSSSSSSSDWIQEWISSGRVDLGGTGEEETIFDGVSPGSLDFSSSLGGISSELTAGQPYGGDITIDDRDQPVTMHMQWHSTGGGNSNLLSQQPISTNSTIYSPEGMLIDEPLLPLPAEILEYGNLTSSNIHSNFSNDIGALVPGMSEASIFKLPTCPQVPSNIDDSHSLGKIQQGDNSSHYPIPPVTISACSRPCSPPLNPGHSHFPPSVSPRKRLYSEPTPRSPRPSNRNSLSVDSIPQSISPAPISPPLSPRLTRSASSRWKKSANKSKKRCQYCPDPSVWKPDQKVWLHEMPPELLIHIFTFACSSLPTQRWICEHQRTENAHSILPRRSTLNGAFPDRRGTTGQESPDTPTDFNQQKHNLSAASINLPPRIRLLQANTIVSVQQTCRTFNQIFKKYPHVVDELWRRAAIGCFPNLPENLPEVQGSDKTNQTTWHNLFKVLIRSEDGLFRRRNGRGAGGVESFGGKSGFNGAVLWREEKLLRAENERLMEALMTSEASSKGEGKGKGKKVDSKQSVPHRRKLLIVCPQPGPDGFTVRSLEGENGYEIGLDLQNGTVFVWLDEYGHFSKARATLPYSLRRSEKGFFPPSLFEVVGDRYRVVKLEKPHPDGEFTHIHHIKNMEIKRAWNLECVSEFSDDHRASVARCQDKDGYLVFNMFASREGFIEGWDKPEEDPRVFCVSTESLADFACRQSIPAIDRSLHFASWNTKTIFKWRRTFIHPRHDDYNDTQRLHYNICQLKLNSVYAVILIRWNKTSRVSYHEFVDRSFQILDLETGATVKVLQFPNFHWDFRHHDMGVKYNIMRRYKMLRMYNAKHAENRATRVHQDEFTLDERGYLVSGSHDYCNWFWDLNKEYDERAQSQRVFTAQRNDAGNNDPFTVLDDFYWKADNNSNDEQHEAWNINNERAGWWVKTPNQVLCFWHNVTTSKNGRWFAACRPGRMFVWDLENPTKVQGFSSALGTYTDSTIEQGIAHPTVETRYLGRLLNHQRLGLEKNLQSWHVRKDILPDQGLWLLWDDGKVVFLDRDDILDAWGLAQEGKRWVFSRDDFGDSDSEDENVPGGSDEEDDTDENDAEQGGGDSALVFVDEEGPVVMGSRVRRKRRRTSTMTAFSATSSFYAGDMGDQFVFDNERPPAVSWEEMDDEGYLRDLGPLEGSSRR